MISRTSPTGILGRFGHLYRHLLFRLKAGYLLPWLARHAVRALGPPLET